MKMAVASARAGLAVAFALVLSLRQAHAERASALFVGSELRLRAPTETRTPGYELTIPHGITSASGRIAFFARIGVLFPHGDAPWAVPILLGGRWAPVDARLSPLFGGELGGYLLESEGPGRDETIGGPQWCWSMRALVGARVRLRRNLAFSVYMDATWILEPQDARAKGHLASSAGGGADLRIAFDPEFRLTDMLLKGSHAPEGF